MNEQLIFLLSEPRGPSQIVEVPVTQNGSFRVPFPDQTQLKSNQEQKVIIKSWRLIPPDVLTNAVLSGNVNAPVAELQKITLVIYAEGWEKGQGIPVLTLNDMQLMGGTAPNAPQQTRFNNWTAVDWTKCYLQYSNGTGGSAGQPYSVIFDIQYIKLNNQGTEIKGPS